MYTAIPDRNGDLHFVSERRRKRFIAAADQRLQQHRDRLSRILKAFDDLEDPSQRYLAAYLRTEDPTSEQPWRLQDIPELDGAEASMRELRDRAFAAMERLPDWENAIHLRSSEPQSFATGTVSLSLGAVITVEIRGAVKTSTHLTVDARWRSGTPGRNIDVRAISLRSGATEIGRTDESGRAELRLDLERYKIELEHEVHGGGGLILDLSPSRERTR